MDFFLRCMPSPPMHWWGSIPDNHEKWWKNNFFLNCCGASWLCSYMSKITSKVYFDAPGPISMLLVQSGKIWYFDLCEHGIPENHGFHEKSWKKWFFGNRFRVSQECSCMPRMVCEVVSNARKCFTGSLQTNGVSRRFPAFVLVCVRASVRPSQNIYHLQFSWKFARC